MAECDENSEYEDNIMKVQYVPLTRSAVLPRDEEIEEQYSDDYSKEVQVGSNGILVSFLEYFATEVSDKLFFSLMHQHRLEVKKNIEETLELEEHLKVWKWSKMTPIIMHMNVSEEEIDIDHDLDPVPEQVSFLFLLFLSYF